MRNMKKVCNIRNIFPPLLHSKNMGIPTRFPKLGIKILSEFLIPEIVSYDIVSINSLCFLKHVIRKFALYQEISLEFFAIFQHKIKQIFTCKLKE